LNTKSGLRPNTEIKFGLKLSFKLSLKPSFFKLGSKPTSSHTATCSQNGLELGQYALHAVASSKLQTSFLLIQQNHHDTLTLHVRRKNVNLVLNQS